MQPKHTHTKTCAACGEGAGTDRTCQKWFVRFRAGDFSQEDAPRLGGPVEVDSNQIETLIENHQVYTTQETADIVKTSKSRKLLAKMKKWVFYFT